MIPPPPIFAQTKPRKFFFFLNSFDYFYLFCFQFVQKEKGVLQERREYSFYCCCSFDQYFLIIFFSYVNYSDLEADLDVSDSDDERKKSKQISSIEP